MCGFFGLIALGRDPIDLERLLPEPARTAIATELRKRGIDDYGEDQGPNHFFAHSRLAIRGNQTDGAQPFQTPNGALSALFNGEIYAIDDFDPEILETRGDTQALRACLAAHGVDDCLRRLNGMFALAIHDRTDNTLSLALDYFGQKPLFYAITDQAVIFGSTAELVALGQSRGTGARTIDRDALASYLMYGFPDPERGIWQGIAKLPPGGRARIDLTTGAVDLEARFQTRNAHLDPARPAPPQDLAAELGASVTRHMISDHPVGICLSGGIDSSLVACHFTRNLIAFSVDDKSPDSEIAQARAYADHNDLKFVTCDLGPDQFADLQAHTATCLDEPHSDSAIVSSAALFQVACRQVKVVLTGDGGDEMFQGYNRHRLYNWLTRNGLRSGLAGRLAAGAGRAAGLIVERLSTARRQQARILRNALANTHSTEAFVRSMLLIDEFGADRLKGVGQGHDRPPHIPDQDFYLPGNNLSRMDRVSLLYGIEARAPLLDLNLLRLSRNVDFSDRANQDKACLKRVHAQAYSGVDRFQAKRGFNTGIGGFVRSDKGQAMARQGADFAADHGFDGFAAALAGLSERRLYSLAALGSWAGQRG